MAGMYRSLNLRVHADLLKSLKKAVFKAKHRNSDADHPEPFFSRSHTGLYFGVLFLTSLIVTVILFFMYLYSGTEDITSHRIYLWGGICANCIQCCAICVALHIFRQLRFTFTRSNTIDRVLLVVSLSGAMLLQLFLILTDAINLGDDNYEELNFFFILDITESILFLLRAIIQACFIVDGLQRCVVNRTQQQDKPGRGVVTFLIITNVAMWFFDSLTAKKVGYTPEKYGSVAWPIISNIGIPLGLFFHFHSSVCLADIWYSAYVQEEEPTYKIF